MRAIRKILTIGVAACAIVACSTTKKTETSKASVHATSETKSNTTSSVLTETKFYGDSLAGAGYVPFDMWLTNDSLGRPIFDSNIKHPADSGRTLKSESKGVKQAIKITPVRDGKGNVIGAKVDFNTIAKPVAETKTQALTQANINTKTKQDTTKQSGTTVVTTHGLPIPKWGRYLLAALVILILIFILKYLLNPLKTWIQTLRKSV